MSKWHSLLEYLQFPLKVLFFSTILLGVGSSIVNPNVEYLWKVDNEIVILISEMLKYTGGFLISLFPFFVFIKVLTKKYEDSVPVFVGLASFIVIMVTIAFLQKNSYPDYFYHNILGIEITFAMEGMKEQIHNPYQMGILVMVLSYFITMRMYKKSRHYSMHGIFSFIDHDSHAMIFTIIISFLVGVALSYIWPFVIQVIMNMYNTIATDTTNPLHLFLYGVSERISAIFGMGDIPRNAFWLGEYGGKFVDSFGVVYEGDVSIWTAQQALGLTDISAGRFITPYYIINIFIVPAFLIAYYSLVNNIADKRRYRLFFVIALLLSIICGNPLPFEIFILILSPLLYFGYLFGVGILYAIFQVLGVSIGYSLKGSLIIANPGSLLDLLKYLRNPSFSRSLWIMGTIGVICFILFFFATRTYFKKFAIGLFSFQDKKRVTKKIVGALGGLDNIKEVYSTPDKITVGLVKRDLIHFETLKEYGAYLVLESKDGYLIRLGNISTIVATEIKKLLKKAEQDKLKKEM
ncbi:MAG: hypothetical protein K2L08_04525 [Erysipelotrichaceae bacterium]|nr:hypothetical protein [Erysipelotrichaceae bacterium]